MNAKDNRYERWLKSRAERGEVVGGGYVVIRRGDSSGRLRGNMKTPFLFEYPTLEAATLEATRLAMEDKNFCQYDVFKVEASLRSSPRGAERPAMIGKPDRVMVQLI